MTSLVSNDSIVAIQPTQPSNGALLWLNNSAQPHKWGVLTARSDGVLEYIQFAIGNTVGGGGIP